MRCLDIKRLGFVLIPVVFALTAGCARPYDPPTIEEAGQVRQSVAPFYAGISNLVSSNTTLHVLWTHGMCSHDDSWVRSRAVMISTALGIPPATIGPEVRSGQDGAYTMLASFDAGHGKFEVTFVVWSPLTAKYKNSIGL